MVKFSKELEAQLIPEWKDAFVRYWVLKKHVKKIKISRTPPNKILAVLPSSASDSRFRRSFLDPICYLVNKFSETLRINGNEKSQIIQVRRNKQGVGGDGEEVYETELLQLFSKEDEVRVFFELLDDELNKVNTFYKRKEAEFLERGEALKNQLNILKDLKQVLHDRRRKSALTGSGRGFFSRSNSELNSDFSESQSGESSPRDSNCSEKDEAITALDKTAGGGINFVNAATRITTKKGNKPKSALRIEIPATNPTKTIAAMTSKLWEDLVINPKKEGGGGGHDQYINRKKIQCAEKMIRGAFVELFRGLGLLHTYSSLNMVAFVKILKKFDKVAKEQASTCYIREVKNSHFISSDKVVKLMDEVECSFIEHFTDNDKKKAMKFLRPQQNNKDSHLVTFFVGLFTGSFVTLFTVYAFLAHMSGMFSPNSSAYYVDTVYPVFSIFALLSLHLFMYGCNLLQWKNTRINYKFIFEFQPNTALKYRDAFLICTSIMTVVVGAMVLHLILISHDVFPKQRDTVPVILLLFFVGLLICPLNIFYRSTRYCFIKVIRNIVCSPFYKVLMVDFFMADQLTSQIPLLRHMESTACYVFAVTFNQHRYATCKSTKMYREFAFVISFAPYYWRAMQCGRRWIDECDINHLANMGKYVSAMVAAGARMTYARHPTTFMLIVVIVTSVFATVYQLYWDFIKDWGVLDPKSKNPWLRDDLILKNKSIYYISIVFNFVLRVAWVENVIKFGSIGMFESRMLDFLLASLEVIRRGHWNFYRLENEHLNNVGKYRALKTVPLPFRELDSD